MVGAAPIEITPVVGGGLFVGSTLAVTKRKAVGAAVEVNEAAAGMLCPSLPAEHAATMNTTANRQINLFIIAVSMTFSRMLCLPQKPVVLFRSILDLFTYLCKSR
jgi:hypothetical protein